MPVDGTEMPVDTGDSVRIQAFNMNAQQSRTLMNSLQLYHAAIFAFGNDAASY